MKQNRQINLFSLSPQANKAKHRARARVKTSTRTRGNAKRSENRTKRTGSIAEVKSRTRARTRAKSRTRLKATEAGVEAKLKSKSKAGAKSRPRAKTKASSGATRPPSRANSQASAQLRPADRAFQRIRNYQRTKNWGSGLAYALHIHSAPVCYSILLSMATADPQGGSSDCRLMKRLRPGTYYHVRTLTNADRSRTAVKLYPLDAWLMDKVYTAYRHQHIVNSQHS